MLYILNLKNKNKIILTNAIQFAFGSKHFPYELIHTVQDLNKYAFLSISLTGKEHISYSLSVVGKGISIKEKSFVLHS